MEVRQAGADAFAFSTYLESAPACRVASSVFTLYMLMYLIVPILAVYNRLLGSKGR